VWEDFIRALRASFERAVGGQGSPLVTLTTGAGEGSGLAEHLRALRAWGVVADVPPAYLQGLARTTGLPAIMVDEWERGMGIDAVLQDDFGGGEMAVRHLMERNHKRIGWFGPIRQSCHSRERHSGAGGLLAREGLTFSRTAEVDLLSPRLVDEARRFLSQRNAPTGILALWLPVAAAVAAAARDLGLLLGADVDLVGWCAEEIYETTFLPAVGEGAQASSVVWSASAMAETAVSRLMERRARPNLPAVRINIEARLRAPPDVETGRSRK
jgi:LacI family transcriptional regulator